MSKIISRLLVGLVVGWAGSASAGFIDNWGSTIDTTTGLEWLDLTETLLLPLHTAKSMYAPMGYHYANDIEVSELLSEFNITYQFTPGDFTPMFAADSDVVYFASLFGSSRNDFSSMGGYEIAGSGRSAYLCLSIGTCGPRSFTNDVDTTTPGDSQTGHFFVRDAPVVIAPATLPLLGLGLAALGFITKRNPKLQSG